MRIAGDRLVFVGVQLLQFLHRLEAHGGCGVVEAQHVCTHVHHDGAGDGVSLRNFGEEPAEQRLHDFCENLHGSRLFADFHNAEPKRQNTCEADGNFESGFRHVECAEDRLVENAGIAEGNPLNHAGDKGAKEKYEPNDI